MNEEILFNALEIIDNPIKHFKSELKEGEQLNGQMAVQLSNDANWLRSVATNALKEYSNSIGDNQEELWEEVQRFVNQKALDVLTYESFRQLKQMYKLYRIPEEYQPYNP